MNFLFKMARRLSANGVVLLLLGLVTACDRPPTGVSTADADSLTIELDTDDLALMVGERYQLSAEIHSTGTTQNPQLSWTVSDATVLAVTEDGEVSGLSSGTSYVLASIEESSTDSSSKPGNGWGRGGRPDSTKVTVAPVPVAEVVVDPATLSLQPDAIGQFTVTTLDSAGNALTGRDVAWASSNEAIARVASDGRVYALAVGEATVTATSENQTGTSQVVVSATPVASVQVQPENVSLEVEGQAQLDVEIRDEAGNLLTDRAVSWESGSPAVTTVAADGMVTAVGPGTGFVTATSEGRSDTVLVQVAAPTVASVQVQPGTADLTAGATVQLDAILRDADGTLLTGHAVVWATTDPAVATVTSGGLVAGVAAGSALVTATSEGQADTAEVTVTAVVVASVSVEPGSAALTIGGTVQLQTELLDADGSILSGRAVTWTSSAPAVASVSSAGLVAAYAAGTAIVTATSEGVSGQATITVADPPSTTTPDFFSDWSTATGSSAEALRDMGKARSWDYIVDSSDPNISVVAAAGAELHNQSGTLAAAGWPTANALRSVYTGTTSGVVGVGANWQESNDFGNAWREPAVGEYLYLRWYWVHDGDDALGGSEFANPHSPQMGPAGSCPRVWSHNFGNRGDNGAADGTYRVSWNNTDGMDLLRFDIGGFDEDRGHPDHANAVLIKGAVYRFEGRIFRAATNAMNWEARVYDAEGALVYSSADFIDRFQAPMSLGDTPPPTLRYTEEHDQYDCMRGLMVGVGGQGVPPGVVTYTGALAVTVSGSGNAWIGPWNGQY